MKKAKSIVNLPVIVLERGNQVESIRDVLFSQNKKKVLGFLLDEGGWFKGAKILLLKDIHNIGKDAVIIKNEELIMSSTKVPEVQNILEDEFHPFHMEVIDDKGNKIGFIEDILFDKQNGKIESLEITEGVFDDIINGRLKIPVSKEVAFEDKRIIISSEYLQGIDKTGGIKKYFYRKEGKED